LNVLGFSSEEISDLFSMVSAILLLGNIEFTGNDQVGGQKEGEGE
jgi:myosin heavy subunit